MAVGEWVTFRATILRPRRFEHTQRQANEAMLRALSVDSMQPTMGNRIIFHSSGA